MSNRYYKDRAEAGRKLAEQLAKYRYENTAVMALSPGGVLVGQEIARALHCTVQLLLTEPVQVADFGGETVGVVDEVGQFTYNNLIPAGVLEEMMLENRNVIEQQKIEKLSKMHRLLGEQGLIDPHIYYGHNVIVVSDGLKSGLSFAAAANFLKPVKTQKIIAAIPVASVKAVDELHVLSDEIITLSVVSNYFDTNHYYEDNQVAEPAAILASLNQVITKWA